MKKAFLFVLMGITGMGLICAQKVTLLTPNGGMELVSGTPQSITWSYAGLSGNETLLIALESNLDHGAIGSCKVSQQSLEWLVGQKMDGTFAQPGTYKIIIEIRENDAIHDLSDKAFTIAPPLSVVALMTPNGSELLAKGSDFDIKWSCSNKKGLVTLNLIRDEKLLGPIAQNLPAGSLHYNWHVGAPLLNNAGYGVGTSFRIQVLWHSKPVQGRTAKESDLTQKNSDKSDGTFIISGRKPDEQARDTQVDQVN